MTPDIYKETREYIPLKPDNNVEELAVGAKIPIGPHTQVTSSLSFGKPCEERVGEVLIETHGTKPPQVVTVVRCTAKNCQAAFFPSTVKS